MFYTLSECTEASIEIKKSRFIAVALPIASREEALQQIDQQRRLHPDARHHCWAFAVGRPENPQALGISDAGEPAGTAGRPILNAIHGRHAGNVCVVVSRYFGGIKLGAGGLVRAYSAAASAALDAGTLLRCRHKILRRLQAAFSVEQPLRHWLSLHSGNLLLCDYGEGLDCVIEIDEEEHSALLAFAGQHAAMIGEPGSTV